MSTAIPENAELHETGMSAAALRSSALWFDLVRDDTPLDLQGRLIIDWTGLERSWYRWASRNDFPIDSILEESFLLEEMPDWRDLVLSWKELSTIPTSWCSALMEWRGIYLITDQSDGKSYVGSAYGKENLFGRWTEYAKSGHGGNIQLKQRNPNGFVFLILQRVAPDMAANHIIDLENGWKNLYAVTTNTSPRDLLLAGIGPGLLLGGAFMLTAYIFARVGNHPRERHFELSVLWSTFKAAIIPLLIPVIVVGGLIAGIYTPTEAAALGVVIALIFGFVISRDLTSGKLYNLQVVTTRQTATVMMIIAGSAVLGVYLANEQIPQQIASALGGASDIFWVQVILINLFLLVLGMFLHASAAIIVVEPLLLPLAIKLGIDPIHFGIMVCLNLGIGQQTPPVASVLLTVCSATGVRIEEVMRYGKWFIATMFVVLMLVSFIPGIAIWWK